MFVNLLIKFIYTLIKNHDGEDVPDRLDKTIEFLKEHFLYQAYQAHPPHHGFFVARLI